jgi:hypothetical protein
MFSGIHERIAVSMSKRNIIHALFIITAKSLPRSQQILDKLAHP